MQHCCPVVEGEQLVAVLTTGQIGGVPQARWKETHVSEVMTPVEALVPLSSSDELSMALERVAEEEGGAVPVMAQGKLLGMIGREEVLNFIRMNAGLGMGRAA
jgi:predicted transcriptional regulator